MQTFHAYYKQILINLTNLTVLFAAISMQGLWIFSLCVQRVYTLFRNSALIIAYPFLPLV